ITYFSAGDATGPPGPELHVGILLDVSESMGQDIGFTRTAAIKFLNTLTDANTALYDAIGLYLDGAGGQSGRKVMLLYTDGGDTRSAMRFGELLDLLKASDVTVYTVGVLEHQTQSAKAAGR